MIFEKAISVSLVSVPSTGKYSLKNHRDVESADLGESDLIVHVSNHVEKFMEFLSTGIRYLKGNYDQF